MLLRDNSVSQDILAGSIFKNGIHLFDLLINKN